MFLNGLLTIQNEDFGNQAFRFLTQYTIFLLNLFKFQGMQDFRAPEEFFVTPDLASCGERSSFIQSTTQKNWVTTVRLILLIDPRFTVTFQLLLLLDLFFAFLQMNGPVVCTSI